jgi:hypothetical protein
MPVTVRRPIDRQKPGERAPWEVDDYRKPQRRLVPLSGSVDQRQAQAVGDDIASELE